LDDHRHSDVGKRGLLEKVSRFLAFEDKSKFRDIGTYHWSSSGNK
jgi:hypothetical protein